MKSMITTFFFIFFNIGWLYLMYRFMCIFFSNKYKSKVHLVISYGIYFFVSTVITSLFPYPIVNTISSLTIIFLITTAYKGRLLKRILITIYIFTCGIIAEMIVGFIYNTGNLSIHSEALYNDIFINFLVIVVIWAETVLTQKFVNVKSNVKLPKIFVLTVSIVPISTITLEFFIMYNQGFNQTIRLVSMICVMASNFILIYLFDSYSMIFKNHAQTELVKRERDYYHEQSELLQNNNENLRMFRHDIKNQLITLNGLISNNKYDLAMEKVERLTEHLDNVSTFSKSDNFAIDSIINYKLSRAADAGINVTCNITIPTKIPFNDDDMVIILGNLLDNAIEACKKVKENPYVTLKLKYDRNSLLICVENNYSEPLNIINNKIHTTKSDTTIHGIGLKSVAAVAKKYDGKPNYSYDNNIFQATVFIYANEA